TLFDDVIKNIENNSDFKRLLEELILEGKKIIYNVDAHELGLMYGILKKDGNNIAVSNKIFEIRIYNYLLAMRDMKKGSALTYEFRTNFIDENGNLMMETVLEKFQELMKAEYRDRDKKFIEREGRLLFLSFLRPIINGVGFYFVEPETRQDNRMDIVVTYNKKKYIIELKIWHGKAKKEDGEKQLASYLESQSEEKGYLVLYSFNKNMEYTAEDILCEGKNIFEVVV
ncbi:MAG: AAA family ATPase, partial [Fusobacteriia bacterium 4572_132]